MNQIVGRVIGILKNLSKMMTIILFSVVALCDLLMYAGGFPNGFFPVIGQLLEMMVILALDLVVVFLLLIKKNKYAKIAFYFVFAYNFINLMISGFEDAGGIVNNVNALLIIFRIFTFISSLAAVASIVLYIIGRIKNNELLVNIAFLMIASIFVLLFSAVVLIYIYYGINGIGWTSWFYRMSNCLILPAALFFGFLYFIHNENLTSFDDVDDVEIIE